MQVLQWMHTPQICISTSGKSPQRTHLEGVASHEGPTRTTSKPFTRVIRVAAIADSPHTCAPRNVPLNPNINKVDSCHVGAMRHCQYQVVKAIMLPQMLQSSKPLLVAQLAERLSAMASRALYALYAF